jgi:uncharacterized RDD family membrane protein YckC
MSGASALDTVLAVETPEGVRLELRPAGPVPRALAFLLDASIRGVIEMGALTFFMFTLSQDVAAGFSLLVLFAVEWFYPVAFEMGSNGRTPGKVAVGLRVVNDDGTPIDWSSSILRNLLLAADWVPGVYTVALASMLATRDFQRLGDLAAGTLVVHADRPAAVRAREREAHRAVPLRPLAPPIPLRVEEQRALIAFAEREARFSDARSEELARLAEPLLAPDELASRRVARIAAWLSGRAS